MMLGAMYTYYMLVELDNSLGASLMLTSVFGVSTWRVVRLIKVLDYLDTWKRNHLTHLV